MLALQVKVKAKLDLGTKKEKQYMKRHIKLLYLLWMRDKR